MKLNNGILTIGTTQSNAYGIRQLKTAEEMKNGLKKLSKSNMKKITIYRDVQLELFKLLKIQS
jgi:hypothetical protein